MNDSTILTSVREELLTEARQSPGLLADLANLEKYVAETYSSRSFIELLQNADDAQAGRFVVMRSGEWLLCGNDGQAFSRQDFYSLCRSASSSKQRGQTIGYRGIGFKSIVGVAESIHLFSGALQASFSRELTRRCLGADTPTPLVRVPHPLAIDIDDVVLDAVKALQVSGLTTVFVLGGLDSDRINDEFAQFDADYLLFLRNVKQAELTGYITQCYTCTRQNLGLNVREVVITGPDRRSAWRITNVGECDIAHSLVNGVPVPLTAASAIVHAFLPTLETTGMGVRINADFSTDPSRTRIVFDAATYKRMDEVAKAVANLIRVSIADDEHGSNILKTLVPTIELATLSLQKKSFRTEFISRVKTNLSTLKNEIMLAPAWLNECDSVKLATTLKVNILPKVADTDAAQTIFYRYLGIQIVTPSLIAKNSRVIDLSLIGCAELIAFATLNNSAGLTMRELSVKPIWWSGLSQGPMELSGMVQSKSALSVEFVAALDGAGLSQRALQRLLLSADFKSIDIDSLFSNLPEIAATSPATSAIQLSVNNITTTNTNVIDSGLLFSTSRASGQRDSYSQAPITSQSLPAWRGAEQYVTQLMQQYGYSVEDRSRQNLGYDLYAEKNNDKLYLEVKLLDYAGQPFIITTNEEVVARQYGDKYVLALTLRAAEVVHIQFIKNPAQVLRFVRQCRQWVWECSEYVFTPTHTV